MTKTDAVAAICARTLLTPADVEALLACSPAELTELVASYNDMGKTDSTTWAIVLAVLKECVEIANILIPLEGAVQGAIAIGQAAKS